VIITSHILGSLTGICDDIHLLRDGKITFSKAREDFVNLEQEIFRDADLGYADLVNSLVKRRGA
jgi:ABC-2 type transport system ATP-binding protein